MKRNQTTTMTLGARLNTSPTAIFSILPVFSLEHKMSDKWMLDLTFPKYGYIRKDVFGNGRLSAGIRYEGELFFTYPKQTGFMDTYTYNRSEIGTELMYEYHLSQNFIFTIRGGVSMFTAFFIFFYFFVHCTEQGTHFRLFSEYPFQKKFGCDQRKFEHQFLVPLQSQGTEFCDVGVQFFGSPVLSLAASFGGIPLFWQNAPLYSDLFVMPVNGYTHTDGCFTVFQEFCLQNEEQDVHCSLFHTRFLLVVEHVLLCQPERGGRDVFSVAFLFEGYENHRIFSKNHRNRKNGISFGNLYFRNTTVFFLFVQSLFHHIQAGLQKYSLAPER